MEMLKSSMTILRRILISMKVVSQDLWNLIKQGKWSRNTEITLFYSKCSFILKLLIVGENCSKRLMINYKRLMSHIRVKNKKKRLRWTILKILNRKERENK